MKKLLIILLISFNSYAFDYSEFVHKIRVNYGIVKSGPDKGLTHWGYGTGTATDVTEYGFSGNTLLTAWHVTEGKWEHLEVLINNEYYEAKVLISNEIYDIALISIEIKEFNLLKLTKLDIKIGDKLFGSGYPHGESLEIDSGTLKRKSFKSDSFNEENVDFWISTVIIEQGWSGGPILDKDYNVLGIIVMYRTNDHNGIFVPIMVIRKFLSKR